METAPLSTSLIPPLSASDSSSSSSTGASLPPLSSPLPIYTSQIHTTIPTSPLFSFASSLSSDLPEPATLQHHTTPLRSPSHPALSLSNIRSHVTEVLDYSNYLLWRELFLPIFFAYQVSSHIDGTPPPLPTSPGYLSWRQIDALVLSWIQSTISRDILHAIISPGSTMTAYSAWSKIEALFRDHVESRIVQLRQEFYSIKKGELSMQEFLLKLKELFDCRISVGDTVTDRDLLLQIVMGLGPDYNTITSIFSTQQPSPTFNQMKSMLLLEEAKLNAQRAPLPPPPDQALVGQSVKQGFNNGRGQSFGRGQSRGNNNKGRRSGGRGTAPFRPKPVNAAGILGPPPTAHSSSGITAYHYQHPVTCYRCGGFGHTMNLCPSILKETDSTPQAFNVFPAIDQPGPQWIFDSGASVHMTNNNGSTHESSSSHVQ